MENLIIDVEKLNIIIPNSNYDLIEIYSRLVELWQYKYNNYPFPMQYPYFINNWKLIIENELV